jgi:hypothetical protein
VVISLLVEGRVNAGKFDRFEVNLIDLVVMRNWDEWIIKINK